jgi:U4/U6.U5 tri-snRNP-associated protein 1
MANGDGDDGTPKLPTAERRLAKEGGNGGNGAVIDDEDLQAALARQRRAAGKKRIQAMKEEDAARRTMEESSIATRNAAGDEEMPAVKAEDGEPSLNGNVPPKTEEDDDDDGLLIMNDTSEFIRNISARPLISKKDQPTNRKNKQNGGAFVKVKSEPRDDDIDEDVPLDEVDMSTKVEEDEEDEEPEEGEALSEEDTNMAVDNEEEDVKPDIRNASSSKASNEDDKNPSAGFGSTADEKLISGGMASTLSLLRQSGLIKPLTPEEIERDRAYKEKERFIAEARLRDAQRDMERARLKASGSGGGETKKGGNSAAAQAEQTQREYENKRLQFQHAQKTLEAFKDYKPNVEITYHDEFGRNLTPKEAWKDLSHKFHGKGSGTNKREKLLKKIEEERKREAMASGDSPLNTNTAFQARQERLGTATMVLGVGNKKCVYLSSISFLDCVLTSVLGFTQRRSLCRHPARLLVVW